MLLRFSNFLLDTSWNESIYLYGWTYIYDYRSLFRSSRKESIRKLQVDRQVKRMFGQENRSFKTSNSFSLSKGLETKSVKPAAIKLSRAPGCTYAVEAIIGTSLKPGIF